MRWQERDLLIQFRQMKRVTTDMKKMISWNVNGLRAAVTKGFLDFFRDIDADIFCIQESKLFYKRTIQFFQGIFSKLSVSPLSDL